MGLALKSIKRVDSRNTLELVLETRLPGLGLPILEVSISSRKEQNTRLLLPMYLDTSHCYGALS